MTETQSNRPKDNALYQQRLKAWKPIMTFRDAAIFFFVSGLIVLGLGIWIFLSDQAIQEYVIPYTDCTDISKQKCNGGANSNCNCSVGVFIDKDIPAPVYFYYGLNNFYQNHRQLIKSYDMNQLMGLELSSPSPCVPFLNDKDGFYYAPCGQMANVMFNDTFTLIRNANNIIVPFTSANISLSSDKSRYAIISSWNNTVKPPNWATPVNLRYINAYKEAEELIVWMRPAPLPRFRKLHKILSTMDNFSNGLPAGNYTLEIVYNYPVRAFSGEKFVVITNLSWIGGKNASLGILFLVTGSIEIVIGIVVLILFLKYPVKPDRQNSFVMSSNL